jgi:hypothetical protein
MNPFVGWPDALAIERKYATFGKPGSTGAMTEGRVFSWARG